MFDRARTEWPMAAVMPKGVRWIRSAVVAFEPERNRVVLEEGSRIAYRTLVAAPGIELHWAGIDGLQKTLGKNGVTSNYLFEMAPYTWELVQTLKGGRALFTQPPMPIKCAGAPQKAMYLACDAWRRRGVLADVAVEFHTATPVLFGVKRVRAAAHGLRPEVRCGAQPHLQPQGDRRAGRKACSRSSARAAPARPSSGRST